MSDYKLFLQERNKIDSLIEQGYKIKAVIENLNGAYVEFERHADSEQDATYETLHITTADARKYFSVKLIEQAAI